MGIDISVRQKGSWKNEDQRWLGRGGVPRSAPKDIVLDLSKFDLVTQFPNGFIPSGVAVGKVTTTGLYGKYDDTAVDGRQIMRGHLFTSEEFDRDSTAGKIGASLHWDGEVVETYLPANHGVDAAGKVDVAPGGPGGALINYVTDQIAAS